MESIREVAKATMKILGWDCGCEERKKKLLDWFLRRTHPGRMLLAWLGIHIVSMGEHVLTAEGVLSARVRRGGVWGEPFVIGRNTITDAAADFLANDFFDGSTDVTAMDFHHWGTGACAIPPACGSTALVTAGSEARVAGTASKPAARQYRTVATITADGTKTITEWGLFNLSAAGIAWSLRCFAGIALVLNDAIEFTYTLTVACVTG